MIIATLINSKVSFPKRQIEYRHNSPEISENYRLVPLEDYIQNIELNTIQAQKSEIPFHYTT